MSVGIHLLSIRLPCESRHLKAIFEGWNVLTFFPTDTVRVWYQENYKASAVGTSRVVVMNGQGQGAPWVIAG